ncbi:tetratricopeptide repeat protein [Amycolatopsis magusensis]|uniref:tetratricopeptide repeat protein n=1 Tax=Amycolatopsis magusensis TaxID=882444 RepID=UPI003C2E19CA
MGIGEPGFLPPGRRAPALDAAVASVGNLPRDTPFFTGRTEEFGRLCELISATRRREGLPPIFALDGMPGIGKTALAVHVAHAVAGEFPDGVHFLDLHGYSAVRKPVDPAEALQTLLIAFGLASDQVPPGLDQRSDMWQSRTAGQRMLLVVDNVENEDQIRSLLPNSPGPVMLITSRCRLVNLNDLASITLDVLSPENAVNMFVQISGKSSADRRDANALMRLCGYLPLAVALTAGRLRSHPTWAVEHLATQLKAARIGVDEMYAGHLSVGAAFDLSYRDLLPEEKQLFRRLALHPGADIDVRAAASLDAGTLVHTGRRLESLFLKHLVDEPEPGRYRLHDLIREYAVGLSERDSADEREIAVRRVIDYYRRMAVDACDTVYVRHSVGTSGAGSNFRTSRDAEQWIVAERANLDACIDYAATNQLHGLTTSLSIALHPFLVQHGQWDRAATMHHIAMASARQAGDRAAEAWTLLNVGSMRLLTGHHAEAASQLGEAISLFASLGDQRGEAFATFETARLHYRQREYESSLSWLARSYNLFKKQELLLGQAHARAKFGHLYYRMEEYSRATENLVEARQIYVELDHRPGQASVLIDLSKVQGRTGRYLESIGSVTRALDLYVELGDTQGQAHAMSNLGRLNYRMGKCALALEYHAKAGGLYATIGDRLNEAHAANNEGRVRNALGDRVGALDCHSRALAIYGDLADPLGRAHALINLGWAYYGDGEYSDAARYFDRAHALYVQVNSFNGQANALMGRGCVHQATECSSEAIKCLQAAYELFGDDRACRAETLYHLGKVEIRRSDPASGQRYLKRSLDLAQAIGARLQEAHIQVAIGRGALMAEQKPEARKALHLAAGIFAELDIRESPELIAARIEAES